MRGLVDKKGEQFAYVEGTAVYTLEGDLTGRIAGEFVLDLAGNKVWRIVGDGVYSLDSMETVGFFTGEKREHG